MFVYQVLFWLGTVGFGAMVAMGFLHGGGHHGNGNGHGHAHPHLDLGHGHGHGHALGHGAPVADVGHAAHGTHGAHPTNAPGNQQSPLTSPKVGHGVSGLAKLGKFGKFKSIFAVSPIDIFALSLGAGATGILARHSIDPAVLPWVAALGAIALNYGIVRPMFMLAMKFVGVPSEGLAGAITRTCEAMTKFDPQGRGLVHIILDGEEKQLLANLDQADRELGVQVSKGDQLLILDVDPVRNTCRVTRV